MSLWPRLRRRRRSASAASRANPFSARDLDKGRVVHEELQSQRAEFASEKGVAVELVRFLSRSSRGWIYLPSETPSGSTTPCLSQDGSVTPILFTPDVSEEFALLPPAIPLPPAHGVEAGSAESEAGGSAQEIETFPVEGDVLGLDRKGDSRNAGRLVATRNFTDEAWTGIRKTAAVLAVKVLVFSRALEASTALAFTVAVVVHGWSRGKRTFRRVFSALSTQLLSGIGPHLLLQLYEPAPSLTRAAPNNSAAQLSGPEQIPPPNAMKVSPVTEDPNVPDLRSSSFAFPVLVKELTSTSPRFPGHQGQADSALFGTNSDETSPAASPLAESNKLASSRPCNKLKSKLFKCSPARSGENSSPLTGEVGLPNLAPSSSSSSCSVSPTRGKRIRRKSSCIARSPISGSEEEYEDVDQATSLLKPPKKVTRSHELLFFRSPNSNRRRQILAASKEISAVSAAAVAAERSTGVQNLSRSQELKLSLKNLGKRKVSRSQEFTTSSPSVPLQDLALPKSTVEGLEALAFPFKAEDRAPQQETRSTPCSPRPCNSIKRSSLSTKSQTVQLAHEKSSSRGPSSPRSSTASAGGSANGGKSKTTPSSTSASSSNASAMLAAAELKPKLRKVRTGVSTPCEHQDVRGTKTSVIKSHHLPSQTRELGRSQVLSHEILGSILLLSILASLLLGRIPAILCTSSLCLILSHLQRIVLKHVTPKDLGALSRSPGTSRLYHATSSPAQLQSGLLSNQSSPFHEKLGSLSSEYRKRVLIEGFLDRGNRRVAPS